MPESILREVWMEVLKIDEGDFYETGGSSMDAILIESALLQKGWSLSAADILQNPKIHEMAALMVPAEEIDWEVETE